MQNLNDSSRDEEFQDDPGSEELQGGEAAETHEGGLDADGVVKPEGGRRRKSRRGGAGRALEFDFEAPLRLDLNEAAFVIYDIETTGGNPTKNGITEIFAAKVRGGEIVDRFYSLVDPKIPIPPIVRKMTGITNKMLQGQPVIEEVMPRFLEFAGADVVVSHNAIGDLKFLRHFAKKTAGHDFLNYFICTHLLAQKLLPEAPKKSLGGLMEHLKVDMGDKHRAESDALATKILFEQLCSQLRDIDIHAVIDAVRYQGDIESSIRVGWDLSRDALNSVPPSTGIFYLYNKSRHLIFASSAQSMQAELKKLGAFSQTAKNLVRHVIHASDIQFDRYPNLFSAMVEETKVYGRFPQGFSPSQWHGRQVDALQFVREPTGIRLRLGALEPNCFAAFGPVFDRKRAQKLMSDLSHALKKFGKNIHDLDEEAAEIMIRSLGRGFLGYIARSLFRTLLKPFAKVNAGGWTPTARARLALELRGLDLPPNLEPLLSASGVIAVPSGSLGQVDLYTIASCRVVNHQRVAGNLEKMQLARSVTDRIKKEIQAFSASVPPALDPGESRTANAVLWFIYQGVNKKLGRFASISEF